MYIHNYTNISISVAAVLQISDTLYMYHNCLYLHVHVHDNT